MVASVGRPAKQTLRRDDLELTNGQKARSHRAFWQHLHAKSETQTSGEIRDQITQNSSSRQDTRSGRHTCIRKLCGFWSFVLYWRELDTAEKTLLAFEPMRRMEPTTITRITARASRHIPRCLAHRQPPKRGVEFRSGVPPPEISQC
jgi:hypothetical protein